MRSYTIFHPFLLSFFSKSLYRDVGRNWRGAAFLYLLLLLAVCSIPPMVKIHLGFTEFVKKTAPGVVQQIPDITISGGEASIKEPQPYIIKDPDTGKPLIIIDTTGKYTSLNDTKATALLTKTEFIVKRNARETRIFKLSEFDKLFIDQDRINSWLEIFRKWIAIVLFPFALVFSFIYRIVQALVYALFGLLFAKATGSSLDYDALLSLAIVAITPAVILNTVRNMLGIPIPLWWFICFVIAMGYLFFAVAANRNEGVAETV